MDPWYKRNMDDNQNNPFQGVTLLAIVTYLVKVHGWVELARRIPINSFQKNPSMKSSLTFLRRTSWAREKMEDLYLETKRREKDTEAQSASAE